MAKMGAITIQQATVVHAAGILECLRLAFEPYREYEKNLVLP